VVGWRPAAQATLITAITIQTTSGRWISAAARMSFRKLITSCSGKHDLSSLAKTPRKPGLPADG
jgi:hypothetical protein